MRVAIYGGSFDPPHMGHALVAAWLRWTGRVDEVWLLPTFVHAFGKEMAPFAFRRGLCAALAEAVGPWVRVEAIEAELPTPSYTIDTLRALRGRHPEHTFRLVVGSDNLASLSQWRAWDEVEAEFSPLFVGRQGHPAVEGALAFPDVSSTEVRRRLREGRAVDHLVPAAVLARLGRTYR